jgi:hypothetical protein
MRTAEVKLLMREVLATLPKPYSDHVIDDVFGAVERNRGWRQRYETQCDSLGKAVVNAWGGYWVANALGKVGEHQVPSKKSSLIGSYSVLDTDAKTVMRKPKDGEARQVMADYYRAHQAELPSEIRKHRELIVELLMEGMPVAEAFQMVLKAATGGQADL